MNKEKNLGETYKECDCDGMYTPKYGIDKSKIKSMIEISNDDFLAIESLKKDKRWNSLYKIGYDSLHTIAEAFLLTQKLKSQNHICLFAYICKNDNRFDFKILDEIRKTRNGINYYGEAVNKENWEKIETKLCAYIQILKEEIYKKIREE